MGEEQAADGHGNGTEDESGRRGCERTGKRMVTHSEIKKQIHSSQAKKGDVGEAVQAAFEAGVTTEPILAAEEQPHQQAGQEAEKNPEPRKKEVGIC